METRLAIEVIVGMYSAYCEVRHEMGEEPLDFEDFLWLESVSVE
jgi:hypothetical protein